jgi:hypothetical protein
MVGPRAVTATFNISPRIKLTVNAATGYDTFAYAYTNSTGALFSMNTILVENWTLSGGKNIVLKGGYQADYQARTGFTTLNGKLVIQNGSLRVDGVKVR